MPINLINFGNGGPLVPAHPHLNPDRSIGGWVADTASVASTCLVDGQSIVFDEAKLSGSAMIYGNAKVYGNARVGASAKVFCSAEVYGNARVYGDSRVHGNSRVFGDANISDEAEVYGSASIGGRVSVWGRARISGDAVLHGKERVYGLARVFGPSWQWGKEKPCPRDEQRELARMILERVSDRPQALNMGVFHSDCGTSHCIAGWAQVLRGSSIDVNPGDAKRAYECGVRLLPAMAPFFFESREVALRELRKLAAEQDH